MSEDDGGKQLESPKVKDHKSAAIASCVLWVLSIILSLTIPTSSQLIWAPDAVLLIGFLPLLFSWSPSWPWLVFGVCNLFIGGFLLVLYCLGDDEFPKALHAGKHHLTEYHPWGTWMVLGVIVTVYGAVRLIKNIVCLIRRKQKERSSASSL